MKIWNFTILYLSIIVTSNFTFDIDDVLGYIGVCSV